MNATNTLGARTLPMATRACARKVTRETATRAKVRAH